MFVCQAMDFHFRSDFHFRRRFWNCLCRRVGGCAVELAVVPSSWWLCVELVVVPSNIWWLCRRVGSCARSSWWLCRRIGGTFGHRGTEAKMTGNES